MDAFPMSLLGPEAEVVIAGLPVRQVVGHHAPCAASAQDVKDPVENRAP